MAGEMERDGTQAGPTTLAAAPDETGPEHDTGPDQPGHEEHDTEPDQPEQEQAKKRTGDWLTRLLAAARYAAPAIGLYILLRGLSTAVFLWFAFDARRRNAVQFQFFDGSTNSWREWNSPLDLLLSFDGRWHLLIAEEGYGPTGFADAHGVPYDLRLAFFPLYPWLIRLVAGLTAMPYGAAAIVVSVLASVAAAWAMFAIGDHLWGRRFGIMLAAAWALWPEGITEHAAFNESLFVALAGWALYAVLTRRWVTAGALTLVAGLSRPTVMALIGAVGLAAVVAIVRREDGWRPYVAAALSPLGFLAFLIWATQRLGGGDAWFRLQRTWWNTYFDYGRSATQDLHRVLLGSDPAASGPVFIISALTLVAVVPLFVLMCLHRTNWVLVVFAALVVLLLASRANFTTIPRHALPAFPLLVGPAVALAAARTRHVAVVLVFLALLSGWYGAWVPLSSGHTV
jgi:hypothetical protein